MTSNVDTIQLGKTATLAVSGGSGTGELRFATGTASQCTVTSAGVVTAVSVGTCQITVTKLASGVLLSSSQSISLTVSDSEAKAEADARAKAEAEAAAGAPTSNQRISISPRRNGFTLVTVDLPSSQRAKRAILDRGVTSGSGIRFSLLFAQVLDRNGNATYRVSTKLNSGDVLRIRIGNRVWVNAQVP